MAYTLHYRVRTILALVLLLLASQLSADTLLVRGGTLIDMTGNKPLGNASILVRDGVIAQIWQGTAVTDYPSDTEIIDAKGKFIIPGLIDSHVHYNWYMGALFLSHGITTVNDLSSRVDWQRAVRHALNNGNLRGPRYLYCARVGKANAAQAQQVVAKLLQISDCLRFDANSEEDQTLAFTSVAEASNTSIIAHSYDAVESARLGIDGIEHLEGVAISTIQNEQGKAALASLTVEEGHKNPLLFQHMEPALFDEVISKLIEANVYLNPTLIHEWKGVIDRTAQFESEEMQLLANPSLQYIPLDEKLVSLGQYHWADLALFPANGADPATEIFINNSYLLPAQNLRQQLNEGYRNMQQFLREFVRAGGKLYSGTDTAAASIPGISLHHEMQLYVDAGIPAEAALASSTRWAAELLHIDERLGTIEAGKQADIVILDADPLKDIANTKQIYKVILAGKPVDTTFHSDYDFPFHQYGTVSKHLYHQPPVLLSVSPGSASKNSEITLKISGENFVPASVVLFNGAAVSTRWISTTELSAVLGARQTTQPGSYLLGVDTPAPGGGRVESLEFIIDYAE